MTITTHYWPEKYLDLLPDETSYELSVEWECRITSDAQCTAWVDFGIIEIKDSLGNVIGLPNEVFEELSDTIIDEIMDHKHDEEYDG
jgi:hypothetical protein